MILLVFSTLCFDDSPNFTLTMAKQLDLVTISFLHLHVLLDESMNLAYVLVSNTVWYPRCVVGCCLAGLGLVGSVLGMSWAYVLGMSWVCPKHGKMSSNHLDSMSCLVILRWYLHISRPPHISHHPKKMDYLIFSACSDSTDLHKASAWSWKNFDDRIFSHKAQELLGFWGHDLHMSNVLFFNLKFYSTGHRTTPTKLAYQWWTTLQ